MGMKMLENCKTLNAYMENGMTARIGYFADYEVIILTDDPCKIPCFHIWDSQTHGEEFSCAMKIDSSGYLVGEEDRDLLGGGGRTELMQFLSSDKELGENRHITCWEYLLETWNMNNDSRRIDVNLKMPDYSKISQKL